MVRHLPNLSVADRCAVEQEARRFEIEQAAQAAEREFDEYYARGGTGLADLVWRRIAAQHGVYRRIPEVRS